MVVMVQRCRFTLARRGDHERSLQISHFCWDGATLYVPCTSLWPGESGGGRSGSPPSIYYFLNLLIKHNCLCGIIT